MHFTYDISHLYTQYAQQVQYSTLIGRMDS